jgi:hypothetical protein
MIDHRFKPSYLPQLSAPFKYVIGKLDDEGVDYKFVKTHSDSLEPLQALVDLIKIGDIDDPSFKKPIFLSQDDKVLDGHHRFGSAITTGKKIRALKIMLPFQDAARILNKIQDIYDYENQEEIEEVVAQNILNQDKEASNNLSTFDFLQNLEEDEELKIKGNPFKLSAYRAKPIKESSTTGNFFSLHPIDKGDKYELEFDNLLDTEQLGIDYDEKSDPILSLGKMFFPNVDFEAAGKKYKTDPYMILTKAISEKAKKEKYDGIKYGKSMIQVFN